MNIWEYEYILYYGGYGVAVAHDSVEVVVRVQLPLATPRRHHADEAGCFCLKLFIQHLPEYLSLSKFCGPRRKVLDKNRPFLFTATDLY